MSKASKFFYDILAENTSEQDSSPLNLFQGISPPIFKGHNLR